MKIIPAIDLLNNIVVQAVRGQREKYKPISSKITNSNALEGVIESLLKEYNFKEIYIADLNAIMGTGNNFEIIKKALNKFPKIDFWLDYGIKNYKDYKTFSKISCSFIVGSETLENILELKKIFDKQENKKIILSLDFMNKSLLGPMNILRHKQYWPKKIILMFLDKVGSGKGPDILDIKTMVKDLKHHFFLAGGIRNNKDILLLKNIGCKGAIVSTAIHKKKIIYKDI